MAIEAFWKIINKIMSFEPSYTVFLPIERDLEMHDFQWEILRVKDYAKYFYKLRIIKSWNIYFFHRINQIQDHWLHEFNSIFSIIFFEVHKCYQDEEYLLENNLNLDFRRLQETFVQVQNHLKDNFKIFHVSMRED